MKRSILITMVVLSLLITGCETMQMKPIEHISHKEIAMVEDKDVGMVYLEPGFNFKMYDALLISKVQTQSVVPMKGIDPEEAGIFFRKQLVKTISNAGIFKLVTDDATQAIAGQVALPRMLSLESFFTEMEPGNQALRYFVGYGAGAAKIQVEFEIRDPQTKKLLYKASDRFVGAGGGLGGDSKLLINMNLTKMAEAQAEFMKRIASGGKIEKSQHD